MAKKAEKKTAKDQPSATPFSDALKVSEGFTLADADPRATPVFSGKKKAGKDRLESNSEELSELQEKLYANGVAGGRQRVLLVIQGMDTAGKGGAVRHVLGAVDPQGVQLANFKAPTAEESRHPFLWRIRKELPEAGMVGVFDRSHYEDVLIARVHDLVPAAQWKRRYATINSFEKSLVDEGTHVIKVMLHISPREQKQRLAERLNRLDKHWKYDPADVDERGYWDEYQEAYQAIFDRCSTMHAPWYVVPADRKWYARLAVQNLLLEHLRSLDLTWPRADFDIKAEKKRLLAT